MFHPSKRFVLHFTFALAAIVTSNSMIADAQLFQRGAQRRASRRGVSPAAAPSNCVGPNCVNPNTGTGLTINANEGFEGALPESYFQQPQSQNYLQPQQTYQPASQPVIYNEPAVRALSASQPPTYVQQLAPAVASAPVVVGPAIVEAAAVKPAKVAPKSQVVAKESASSESAALREALKLNVATLQTAIERLDQLEERQAEQSSSAAGVANTGPAGLLSTLPIVRVTVVARDGSEDRQREVDMAQVALQLIAAE